MNNSENEIVNTLLGERISNARIAQGLTITQLAKSVGVTPKTLKNWVNLVKNHYYFDFHIFFLSHVEFLKF